MNKERKKKKKVVLQHVVGDMYVLINSNSKSLISSDVARNV